MTLTVFGVILSHFVKRLFLLGNWFRIHLDCSDLGTRNTNANLLEESCPLLVPFECDNFIYFHSPSPFLVVFFFFFFFRMLHRYYFLFEAILDSLNIIWHYPFFVLPYHTILPQPSTHHSQFRFSINLSLSPLVCEKILVLVPSCIYSD